MPIITDAELSHYQEKEEENERLLDKNEDLKESYDKVIKHRNIFLALALLFFSLVIIGFILKKLKPELFLDKAKLETQGLSVVSSQEYNSLIDFKESQLISGSNTEVETENLESKTSESIGDAKIYAVQIGAFVNNDIELFSDSFTQFREFQSGGFYKYSLGAFETLSEAQEFRKKVINIGFQDAFVASFVNGERVAIENPY